MTNAEPTAEEQLDTLLREGRISPDDYDTLQQALSKGNVEDIQRRREPTQHKLTKKWEGRQLGGVCAGLADFFGLDAWNLRAVFVLAFLLTGGTATIVYLVLYFSLPWSGRDPFYLAVEKERRGNSGVFLASLITLWLFGLSFHLFLVPRLLQIAQAFGMPKTPSHAFMMWASTAGGTYFGLGLQVLILGMVYLLYRMAPVKSMLRYWIARGLWLCVALYALAWVWAALSFQSLLTDVP